MDKKQKLLRNNAFQTVLASLICIAIGLLIGYIVLLIINPAGAGKAIVAIMKNFFYYPNEVVRYDTDQGICPVNVCAVRVICLQSGLI